MELAVYQPNFCIPNNSTVDASTPITFSCTMQGSYSDAYQLIIRDMQNNIKYNTNATPLSQTLYQGDTFSYVLNSGLINGNEYTFTVILWSDSLPINQCFSYNAATPTYTDETIASNNLTANDMHLPPTGALNDAYYFGSSAIFSGVNLTVGTIGSYSATLVWEYYNGTSWVTVPILTDNTSGFTKSGMILFQPPSDWATTAVNSSTKYWIRCRVSAFTSVTTSPLGTQAWMKTSATSRQTPFFCYSTPSVTMTVPATPTSMSQIFTATYSQAQGIAINYWYMVISDNLGNLILQTPNFYSANISYTYSGFISGNSYQIYTVVVNQKGVTTQSPTYSFTVSYSKPSLITIPTATILPDLSAVQVNWSPPVQITGTVTGTGSSYINNLFTPNNTGLNLDIVWNDTDTVDDTTTIDDTTTYNDAYGAAVLFNALFLKPSTFNFIEFDLSIPTNFTTTIDYIPSPSFAGGKMVRLEDSSSSYYEIGYDPVLGCYYYDNNGVIINGATKDFIMDVCLIAIKGIEVLIIYNNQIYDDLHP